MPREEAQVLLGRCRASDKELRYYNGNCGLWSLVILLQIWQHLGRCLVELDEGHKDVVDLERKLSCRRNDNGENVPSFCWFFKAHELLDEGNKERERLSAACHGLSNCQQQAGVGVLYEHTSTTTSLFPRNCGIQAACTGVMRWNIWLEA